MFSEKLRQRRLAQLEASGMKLVEHSIEQVDIAIAHFESLTDRDDKGRPRGFKRTLTADEQEFIDNERLQSQLSFNYWAPRYYIIPHSDTLKQHHFKANIAQRFILARAAEAEERDLPIIIQLLKARQIGGTTLAEGILLYSCLFQQDVSALIASSDPDKSGNMYDKKFLTPLLKHPWWLLPPGLKWVESGEKRLWCNTTDVELTLAHGNQESHIGRGDTFNKFHLCLAKDTLIRGANGQLTKICELDLTQPTIVSTGEFSRLIWSGRTERPADMGVSLRLWGNPHRLDVSADHPILTPTGFRDAGDLTVGDLVYHPVRKITHDVTVLNSYHRPRGASRYGKIIETEHLLDRNFGWLCGLYLAEGSISLNQIERDNQRRPVSVVFSVHDDEVDSIIAKLRNILPSISITCSRKANNSQTSHIRINHNGIAQLLWDNFGAAKTKHWSDNCWNWGEEFCLGMVQGYIEGDGHLNKKTNDITVVSIRPDLIWQLRDMIASLGFGWSNITHTAGAVRYGRNEQDRWDLQINGEVCVKLREAFGWPIREKRNKKIRAPHWRWSDNGGIWIEIKDRQTKWIENYYSLTVEHELHDFLTAQCVVKNTEIADWDDPQGHIEASLLKAIHPSSVTFGMMESTAKGRNDYWHRLWLQAKEGWDKRQSMVMPIFVPWYIASDIYPTAGWLKLIPVPEGWEPDDRTRKHAEAAREYVARSPHFQQLLGSNWQMPKEQQWFYQFEFNRALKNDDLGSFFSEMPATDMEAFQSQARSIFSPLLIDSYASDIPSPKAVFTVLGSEIDPQWVISADEWAPSTIPALHVKHQTKYKSFHWSLQPLKFHGYNETNFELNRLWLWEWPEEGNEYAVSLDGAKGLGKDRTVLEVIKKATPLSRPVQVAEFASDSISVGEILPIWLMLLKLYSVRSASKINWAQAAPEMAAGGDVVMQELIKLGWPNYYVRTATDRATTEVSGRPQIGFETNGRSRDYLVSWLIQFLRKKMVKINSPWLVDEMRNFVRKEGLTKERIEHDSGFHDDRLFAFGIGLVALHQLNIAGQETPQWRDYTAAEEMLTEFTTYSSPTTKGSAAELIDLFMEDSHTPRAPLSIRQLDETDVTMTELFTTFTGGVSLLG